MDIKKQIPNTITLLNLLCGCIALMFATQPDFELAFLFVCLGIFLDFFDGFFARLFKVSGPLGVQLDSLADMVTSGVVPGIIMYVMLSNASHATYLPYLGFIITLGSCYRLAKFNIDERQTDSFIGLPTPANAIFIMSLPLVLQHTDSLLLLEALVTPWVLLVITFFSAFMLNAEIPLFSLKIKNFSLRNNAVQLIFLALSILLLAFLQYTGIPLVIILYILMSVISNARQKNVSG